VQADPSQPTYDELMELVVRLRDDVDRLAAQNAELKRRLGLNSRNSSKPPSSDGFGRAARRSKPSGRRPGKQPGDPGTTLRLSDDPDQVVEHRPAVCAGCAADLSGATVFAVQRRQVVDLPPVRPRVTEHRIVAVACGCGHVSQGQAPTGVTGRVQYGPGLKAAVLTVRAAHFTPFARTGRLVGSLTGVRVSTGSVAAFTREAAARLAPFLQRVRALLRAAPVLGVDETPAWTGGSFKYIHLACTERLALFHAGGRSNADIDAGGVLPGYTGTLVRDGYPGYLHFTDATHAQCAAHLLRQLAAVHDADPERQSWAEAMANTLLLAKQAVAEARAAGQACLEAEKLSFLRAAYAGALAAGMAANPPLPDGGSYPARRLLERFRAEREQVLRFAIDFAVPFTNNESERQLRPVKIQQKVSATWRTLQGLSDFAALRSYLATAAKHGLDPLDAMRQLFTTSPWMPPAPATSS
jgi:transposase